MSRNGLKRERERERERERAMVCIMAHLSLYVIPL